MNIEEGPTLKFEDCKLCRFKRKPKMCSDCDAGELFEERGPAALNFSGDRTYREEGEEQDTFVPSLSLVRHINDLFLETPEYHEDDND